jgi:3-methyladenine DNA glycosylase AlkD
VSHETEKDRVKTAEKNRYLDALTTLLVAKGNPQRAVGAQRDKGSAKTFLAIRVPVLREVALKTFALKELTPANRLEVWDHVWQRSPHYEVMSVPLMHYYAQGLRIDTAVFPVMSSWIDRIDDWGHCDGFAGCLSFLNHNRPRDVMPYLRKLNRAKDDIWRIRASIVALVHYSGKNAVYLAPDDVMPFLDPHLEHKDKYVANAIGWILREMRHVHRAAIDNYVSANRNRLSRTALAKAKLN